MRWCTVSPAVVGAVLALGLASSAQAEAAMFEASLILHALGNDETGGSEFPSNTYTFSAVPLGYDCYNYRRTSLGKTTPPRPLYCPLSVLHKGHPATGVGVLVQGIGATPSIQLPQSAFGVTTTGLLRSYGYGGWISETYATFVNAAGTFFAGGGPAATGMGRVTHVGPTSRTGSWIIRKGKNGFGGPMGLLGRLGATWSSGFSHGLYSGTTSWNMIRALGRSAADPDRTFTNTGTWRDSGHPAGTIMKIATGTPWTTGTVTLYANDSAYFPTIVRRAGYDNRTALGFGNIQLVTPSLTHWDGSGHTGHIGILKLRIVPEPSSVLLLAAGAGVLVLLRRTSRREWGGLRSPKRVVTKAPRGV